MGTISKFGDSPKADKAIKTNIEDLIKKAGQYAADSIAPNTRKAYQSDWKMFCQWTAENRRRTIPATSETVALYITHLADSGRAPSTISRTLTSISKAHELMKFETPTKAAEVSTVYKGICRSCGIAQKRAKPLVVSELRRTLDAIEPSFLGRRDRALLLVGWTGALRRSELVALNRENIDFCEDGLVITIIKSKTDQYAESFKLGIPHAKEDRYCPVKTLSQWIELARIKSGPLFFSVGTGGKKFHTDIDNPKRLSGKYVSEILKKRVEQAGYNPAGYSGHSLRAGFVTSAAAMEVPEAYIQIHTRHRSIATLRGYIRDGDLFSQSNPLRILL